MFGFLDPSRTSGVCTKPRSCLKRHKLALRLSLSLFHFHFFVTPASLFHSVLASFVLNGSF